MVKVTDILLNWALYAVSGASIGLVCFSFFGWWGVGVFVFLGLLMGSVTMDSSRTSRESGE